VVERGFLMVNLWWIRGELWFVGGRVLGVINFPLFLDLFFGHSRFGNEQAFVLEDEVFNGDGVGTVEIRHGLELRDPAVLKVPGEELFAGLVERLEDEVLAVGLSFLCLVCPVLERGVVGDAGFEGDGFVFCAGRRTPGVCWLGRMK
jgi:hypothetical protein